MKNLILVLCLLACLPSFLWAQESNTEQPQLTDAEKQRNALVKEFKGRVLKNKKSLNRFLKKIEGVSPEDLKKNLEDNQQLENYISDMTSTDEKINKAVGAATGPIVGFVFKTVPLYSEDIPQKELDKQKKQQQELQKEKQENIAKWSQEKTPNEVAKIKIIQGLTIKAEPEQTTRSIEIPFVLIWLVVGAIVFTVYMGFINVRGFPLSIDIVRGVYSNPDDKGEVSHFQALTAALSGTVGLGNIAGVAIAISLGGPGATFWMIFAGLIGMSSKFVECTLGVKYRIENPDGTVSGGPMYYLSQGLKDRGMGGFGSAIAIFFAIMCIGGSLGGGNMFQVNQAFQQFEAVTGGQSSFIAGQGWIFGVVVAILVAVVIIGGIRSIAKVTDKIVPFMCGVYVLAALVIILGNASRIPEAIGLIFSGAFAPQAVAGGFVGVLIQGFKRAAFSNEAGIGSASIAHSAVKTNEPITEGLVALLEPFIDTVVVCTMTALVIVITGNVENGVWSPLATGEGIDVTSKAFASVISWFPYLLCLAVILFAFSTMVTWSYYGGQAWEYLFGRSNLSNISFKVIFCIFVVIGAAMNLGAVVDFSDAMIFAMCFPNVIGLYIMAPEVRRDLTSFLSRVKSGEIKKFK